MLFAPLEGWRHVEVTDRHTAVDYAHVLKDLADRKLVPNMTRSGAHVAKEGPLIYLRHATKRVQGPP
jgi:hypothetical protein